MQQIEKNSVSATNQLKKNSYVTFIQEEGKGKKVMFVGNSITRHGILPEIDLFCCNTKFINRFFHIIYTFRLMIIRPYHVASCVVFLRHPAGKDIYILKYT